MKVLNNNVVISVDDSNRDIIVMGSGVAFKKKHGDSIDKTKIERIFTQEDQSLATKFTKLLNEIPVEYLELTEKIIMNAKSKFNCDYDDNLYISLMDHIYFTIQRYNEGVLIKNRLLLDTKMLYRDEFEAGLDAIEILNKEFSISLPEDEAAFIALHFVNASSGSSMENTIQQTKLIQDILEIIKNYFKLVYDEDSISYYRLITHLKFFAQRISNQSTQTNLAGDDALLALVKRKYDESYICVKRISQYLLIEYNYEITEEEILYLTIHIERNRGINA